MKHLFILVCVIFNFISCYSQSAFFNLGKQYAQDNNYEEAIRLTKNCLEWDSKNPDKTDLFFDYCSLCEYFSYTTDVDSCQSYAHKAIDIWTKIEGIEYEAVLSNLSHSLLRAGFIEQAISYRSEIIYNYEAKQDSCSQKLVNQYCIISGFYKTAKDTLNAVKYAKKAETLAYEQRSLNSDFEDRLPYAEVFSNLRYIIQSCEEPIAGIHYLLKCIDEHRDAIDEESRMHTLNSIWAISRDNNFLEGCLAVYKERAIYGNYKEQLTNLINIDVEDLNIKNDVHAAEYSQGLYDLVLRGDLSEHFSEDEIEQLLWLLPDYYGKIGLVRESFEMAKKNYEWRSRNNKDLLFSDIRVLISSSALPDEAAYAAKFGEYLLNSHRFDDDEEVQQMIYENLAGAYLRLGNNDKANFYINKIGNSDEYQPLYAKAGAYIQAGDMKSLLPISIKLNEFKDIPEENRGNVMFMLMMSARDSRQDSIIKRYVHEYVETYREHLMNNIPLMSEEEQAKYIRKIPFSNILSYDLFIGIDEDNCIEWSAAKDAYNYTLLKKGILLTSQNEFRNAIINSPDSMIQVQWRALQNNGDEFSLQNEINKRNLINYATQRSSYLEKLSYTWDDVRNALHEDEAAIEFVICYNFHDFTDKQCDPVYLALIIRKDSAEPITVTLSPVMNFTQHQPNDLLSKDNLLLYNALWHPLEPYLNGVRKVYFSPVENLNSTPLEYASMGADRICDKWELFRVSSTREIIDLPKMGNNRERAVLYGGLQYDLNIDELIAQSRSGSFHGSSTTRAILDDNLRYNVRYLPGSLLEVTDIAKLFSTPPKLITETIGTEESFKALDGSSYDILHLATHGFFWSESDISKHENIDFLHNERYLSLSKEDNAMLRSGLVFSGASVFLDGGDLPEDVDDGILTASELSSLNLGEINLVVMSACDSGLGETSSEGVFGLQRGFKLAGAKSLLMSLWKVDDHATHLLMTEFYRQYLSGKSKRESLYLAQSTLRSSEEFSAPYYWASFILLD